MTTPYASPALYLAKFGRGEAVALLADEERLLTDVLLLEALSEAGVSSGSAAEQAAATAAAARLVRELAVQSNVMDGYLRAAVALPLAAGDANAGTLEDCCLALTRRGLADDSDNLTELVDKAATRWLAWLRDVSQGKALLAGPDGSAVPSPGAGSAGGGRVRHGPGASDFDWERFGGL